MSKLLFDIDDIANCITQGIVYDYLIKIKDHQDVCYFPFSFVENGKCFNLLKSGESKSIDIEFLAYAEENWYKILKQSVLSYDVIRTVNNMFPWACLFRSSDSEISIDDMNDKYVQCVEDCLQSYHIKMPDNYIKIPFESTYTQQNFDNIVFKEKFTVLTSSLFLLGLAVESSSIENIILFSKPWNSHFVAENINKPYDFIEENKNIFIVQDMIAALQIYNTISQIKK